MKKSLLTIAAAATMVAPAIVMADATLYGNVHLSINDFDSAAELDMTSNTSAIGVKGSEALGDGLKAIYKAEFQLDSAEGGFTGSTTGNALTQRDTFVGLKGGMGTVKFGTFSSNYKQLGGKVDPLYRTRLEARGFLSTQSPTLHGGRGILRGRSTNTLQYTSPKMGGVQMVLNTTISGAAEETNGLGLRWSNKNVLAFVDHITNNDSDSTKVGGRYKTKAFSVGLQYETADDGQNTPASEVDRIFLSGAYNINKNNAIIVTAGQIDADTTDNATGFAIAYNHKLSKMTNVYLGYGDRDGGDVNLNNISTGLPAALGDDNLITAGIRKKF